jgi:MoaA/NifB/PqqE/SkfB family radical SAM enzyme
VFVCGRGRLLQALQVEVTSRCMQSCSICPRSALSDRWLQGDLSREHWKRIERDLTIAEHVHLQGWGEPLLYPDLRHLAHAAKQKGCSVGITTNGDLLASAIEWIVAAGVNLVTISVAGDARTHARLRDGSRLDRVLQAAADLAQRARDSRSGTRVQLSYLLTRDNAAQLPDLVEHAADAGVQEVFVTHLDCTPTAELLAQAAFEAPGGPVESIDHVRKAEVVGRRRKVRFRGPALQPQPLLTCALNPLRFAFVAWDGRVGPCVNLLLPVRGSVPRHAAGRAFLVAPLRYGHLDESGLVEVLGGAAREAFIAPFQQRLEAERQFTSSLPLLSEAEALRQLEQADRQRSRALDEAPFPAACRGCHKADGW